MASSPVSRRQFLGTSLKLGAGVAALGVAGAGAAAEASAASAEVEIIKPPGAPPLVQRFVTRPEFFSPPGVRISATPGLASRAGQPGYIFIAPRVTPLTGQPGDSQGFMIMDLAGNLVWWRQSTGISSDPFNFRVQTYQGRPVLTWYQGEVSTTGAYGVRGSCIISDDSYTEIAKVHSVNYGTDLHEFLITPQDTALITAYQPTGDLVIGHVQEIDVATNDVEWYWSCYPTIPTSASYTGTSGDYFHVNSVDLWPGSARDVLISGRNTWGVYLISRATKQVIWSVGGKSSSFAMGGGTRFEWQHDARALADGSGISLFDDASQPSPEKQSWGKVISLDQSTHQATLRHEYDHWTSPIDTPYTGNCQLLPNGGHLIGWGANPYFSEYAPSGNAVFASMVLDGRLPAGIETYRAFMFDWVGHPVESELRLVVHHGRRSGHFYGYVSWNGATEVASWELSGGRSSLSRVATARKDGFETTIAFEAAAGDTDFQVTALDAHGAVLGRSTVVHVS